MEALYVHTYVVIIYVHTNSMLRIEVRIVERKCRNKISVLHHECVSIKSV